MARQQFKKVKPADRVAGWRERRMLALMGERRRATEDRQYASQYVARMYA